MMISDQNLTFWIKNGYNVLLKGKHGVGKTSIVLDAFTKHNLRWQYFSAATMDPWVDFVGVPKERVTEDGKAYLDLVRPKHFQEDAVEAIFMDEFNRSSKKVRNAVMELIQFKSINGKKFNNLKIIWAAVNPDDDEDEEYDVEKLDAAQLDRFQIHIDVPYSPDASYFKEKYGKHLSHAALEWWKNLNKNEKALVSPRRLDYTLDIYNKRGDIRHVMPKNVSVSKLLQELKDGPFNDRMKEIVASKDTAAAKEFINNENALNATINLIAKSNDALELFIPHLNKERLAGLMIDNKAIADYIFMQPAKHKEFLKQVASAKNNKKLADRAEAALKLLKTPVSTSFVPSNKAKNSDFRFLLSNYNSFGHNSAKRLKTYNELIANIPSKPQEDEAYDAIEMLNDIASSSQKQTIIKKMPKLISMYNFLIQQRPSTINAIPNDLFKKLIPLGLVTNASKVKA